jgi:hypothetical protein
MATASVFALLGYAGTSRARFGEETLTVKPTKAHKAFGENSFPWSLV